MFLRIFAIHDIKAKAYLAPFTMRSQGEALRAFMDTCNDPSTQFNRHPEDFTLMFLGEFNDQNGKITTEGESPVPLAKAIELINQETISHVQPTLSDEARLLNGAASGDTA